AFIDPKRSLIDIVQATGRAMRKAEWKEKGYIFIPVVVEEDTDPEKFIESSDFDTVWQVLQAMVDQDQRLEDIVSQLRLMQGKGEEGTQAWKDAMTEYTERIEFYNLPKTIDKIRFINTLYTKTVEVTGKKWDFWYGLTLAYKEQFGDPNAPQSYKTPEGYPLGRWQCKKRQDYKKGRLTQDRVKRLEEIGFTWDFLEESFERGFKETLKYKELFGNSNASRNYMTTEGYKLGIWQGNLRRLYKKGRLDCEKIKKLEEIGFIWDPKKEAFENGFLETIKYKEQYGDANTPSDYKTHQGFKLGQWQTVQRQIYKNGRLLPNRIQMESNRRHLWKGLSGDRKIQRAIWQSECARFL
ncbi:MAG: Helicase associated domain protein, partial [Candidatus Brocadiaceae bacterium]|nr:Helicase associated domain protein [Candidatus Brocadiaceae bacterium]